MERGLNGYGHLELQPGDGGGAVGWWRVACRRGSTWQGGACRFFISMTGPSRAGAPKAGRHLSPVVACGCRVAWAPWGGGGARMSRLEVVEICAVGRLFVRAILACRFLRVWRHMRLHVIRLGRSVLHRDVPLNPPGPERTSPLPWRAPPSPTGCRLPENARLSPACRYCLMGHHLQSPGAATATWHRIPVHVQMG